MIVDHSKIAIKHQLIAIPFFLFFYYYKINFVGMYSLTKNIFLLYKINFINIYSMTLDTMDL